MEHCRVHEIEDGIRAGDVVLMSRDHFITDFCGMVPDQTNLFASLPLLLVVSSKITPCLPVT